MIPLRFIKRRTGEGRIIPHMLRDTPNLRRVIAYYDSMVGKPFKDFDENRAIDIMGDYKLAKSVENCLAHFYVWESRELEDLLPHPQPLNKKGIETLSDLRLYTYSKLPYGFSKDHAILEEIGKELGIDMGILWADHEMYRILRKIDFTIEELLDLYKREVIETFLLNSTKVVVKSQEFDKRLLFLAKKHGLLYDIIKDDGYIIVAYGPVQMFNPKKYSYRLPPFVKEALKFGTVRAEVQLKKKYDFFIESMGEVEDTEFDSFPEKEFFESFRSNYSGWEIEREPEPIIQGSMVVVPDFVISRGESKVYVEVVGFWTEDYKKKKLSKLRQLKLDNLILLIEKKYEKDTKEEFEKLGYPVAYFDFSKKVSAIPVLHLLKKFSDFDKRYEVVKDKKLKFEDYMTLSRLKDFFGVYTDEELDKVVRDYHFEHEFIKGAGVFKKDVLNEIKKIFERNEGKSRKELEEDFPYDKSLIDPMLHHFGYTVEWKNLNESTVKFKNSKNKSEGR